MNPLAPSKSILFSEGTQGTVIKTISNQHSGRISYQGSQWNAKLFFEDCKTQVLPSQSVEVIGREGITLLVLPLRYFE